MDERRDSEWLRTLSRCRSIGLWDAVLHDGDTLHPLSRWTWSDGFQRLLGFNSQAEFPNTLRSWRRRMHPEDLAPTLRAFHATCATGADLDVSTGRACATGRVVGFTPLAAPFWTGRTRRACVRFADRHLGPGANRRPARAT